jgi:hypothetical protein
MTIEEAANALHKSRRWLQDWLRLHPADAAGNPYYAPFGRTKTFDENDLARIRAAVREEERCRLSSLIHTASIAEMSGYSAFTKAGRSIIC